MSTTTQTFSEVPIFQSLSPRALDRLDKLARVRNFEGGEVIVREGDEGVGFFLITAGSVRITRGNVEITKLSRGDFFGEMALLDGDRRSATVTATQSTTCIAVLRSDFIAELRSNADVAIELLAVMSRRVRELDQRLAGPNCRA